MKFRNYWLTKIKEKSLLKIVEWAHRKKKPVESLKTQDIEEALRCYLRESNHG